MKRRSKIGRRKLPSWATGSSLYDFQVREVTQYAMFMLDPGGILVAWNAGVQNLLGYSEKEWVGGHASAIFAPADRAHEICASEMRLAAENGSATGMGWRRRKDGSELFAHGVMTAIRTSNGVLLGYSKILSDETKTKRLQDALTESNRALGQFAHIASHDLQEPLRTVSAYADLLAEERHQLDEEAREFLGVIAQGTRRMKAMVKDLLTCAQVQNQQQTQADGPSDAFSLEQSLQTALIQLQHLIDGSRAVVSHDPLPEIKADQGQMARLFLNLVGNALKYRTPGKPPKIHVSAKRWGSSWVITVRDNGIGFDPKHAETIFAAFKRLHTEEQYEGTGIGLAICRGIVEGHGGNIWAESETGQGASFHFSLPADGKVPHQHPEIAKAATHR